MDDGPLRSQHPRTSHTIIDTGKKWRNW